LNYRLRIPGWLLLLAFCAFLFLWRLASFGLIGADEPRYAQVAREMLARRDWITPALSGSPWLEKPPLYYWQAMIAYSIFGVSDWAARLPSVLDATAMVFALYWFLRRLRPGIEVDGALMLASAAGVIGYARAASMDMPLAASFTIAMLAWYAWSESGSKRSLAAFYVALALATLAKGPVAPFLALLMIVAFTAAQRSPELLRRTLWPAGIGLFLAIALPWYVMVELRNPQFFRVFILEHNLARFGTNLYHHPEPFWYYLPVTLLGWVPWAMFVLVAGATTLRRFRASDKAPDNDRLTTFLVIWIVLPLVFFSLSQSKLPGYILPALPAGIVLLSIFVRQNIDDRPNSLSAVAHALIGGAIVFAALNIQYILALHRVPWRFVFTPALADAASAIAVYLVLMRSGYRALRFVTLVPLVVALAFGVRFGASLVDEMLSARPVWREVENFNPHQVPVALFLVPRETEFGLQFYLDRNLKRYELGGIPEGEHIVVAAQGYPKGVSRSAGRRAVLLRNIAAQKLDIFYVPAR